MYYRPLDDLLTLVVENKFTNLRKRPGRLLGRIRYIGLFFRESSRDREPLSGEVLVGSRGVNNQSSLNGLRSDRYAPQEAQGVNTDLDIKDFLCLPRKSPFNTKLVSENNLLVLIKSPIFIANI